MESSNVTEKRYVIEVKSKRFTQRHYLIKDGREFRPDDDPWYISYWIDDYGYRTKAAAEKRFEKLIADTDDLEEVSLLEFKLEKDLSFILSMKYRPIRSSGFEEP